MTSATLLSPVLTTLPTAAVAVQCTVAVAIALPCTYCVTVSVVGRSGATACSPANATSALSSLRQSGDLLLPTVDDGVNTATIRAHDAAGNVGSVMTLSWTRDSSPPITGNLTLVSASSWVPALQVGAMLSGHVQDQAQMHR